MWASSDGQNLWCWSTLKKQKTLKISGTSESCFPWVCQVFTPIWLSPWCLLPKMHRRLLLVPAKSTLVGSYRGCSNFLTKKPQKAAPKRPQLRQTLLSVATPTSTHDPLPRTQGSSRFYTGLRLPTSQPITSSTDGAHSSKHFLLSRCFVR